MKPEALPTISPKSLPKSKPPPASTIDVEWTDAGKVRRVPVNELIQHGVKSTSMPAGPWVYGGSDFSEGKFVAETSGDVAAIFLSMAALINYPGDDNNNDDVWTPFRQALSSRRNPRHRHHRSLQNAKPLPKP